MNLLKYSKFYYSYVVNEENNYIDFNDGAGVKSAKISTGAYTLESLAVEMSRRMTSLSLTHTFVWTVDRVNRKFVLTSIGGTVSLLFASGPFFGVSIRSTIGFNNADLTGLSTYTSNNATGKVFYPQYFLQNYVNANNTKFPIAAVVNRSSSGNAYEVVQFGSNRVHRFEIMYTTDVVLGENSVIRNNQNGVADLVEFLEYCVNKYPVEFMLDETQDYQYDTIILEKTPQSDDGVSYEISPEYDKNLAEFHSLGGPLMFRRVSL